MIVGVGSGGILLGPLIAQNKGVPFLPVGFHDEVESLSAYADDLFNKRVLVVDMNLNFKNVRHMAETVLGLKEHCDSIAGVYVPTVTAELRGHDIGSNVASMQA